MIRPVRRAVVRGFRGRGWFAWLLVGLVALALLTPSLAAAKPGLAGWSHAHGHLYLDGMPTDHSHPWDGHAHDTPAQDTAASANAVDVQTAEDADGVIFTWDGESVVSAIAVPAAAVLGFAAAFLIAIGRATRGAPDLAFIHVPAPPPR